MMEVTGSENLTKQRTDVLESGHGWTETIFIDLRVMSG